MTRPLLGMADRLACRGVTRVVMEATSDYRKPVFYLLEAAGFETWLVNARDVRHLPGRPETDKLDAAWLGQVAGRQMIRPGFVPPPPIRQLRDLTRYRAGLAAARTAEKNRVEKLLEDAQIKLSVVVSDIFGASGRDMLAALAGGERSPRVLAQPARRTMRKKITVLEEAFTGYVTGHHAFLLRQMPGRVDAITADVAALDARIEEQIAPFAAAVAQLDEITGISLAAAPAVIAGTGLDMTRFPAAGHLVSRAKYAPGVKESAGKKNGKNPAGHGNPYLARILGNAAAAACRTGTFPGERYRRIARRRGATKANVAIGRSILVIIWHLLSDPEARYTDLGAGSTPAASTRTAGGVTTSASSKPSATKSSSNAPPDQHRQNHPAPLTLRRALPRAR